MHMVIFVEIEYYYVDSSKHNISISFVPGKIFVPINFIGGGGGGGGVMFIGY